MSSARRAIALLKDAGWVAGSDGILAKDGKKFNLTISTNSGNTERETLAQVAADQYKQLGINAVSKPEAFQGLVTKLTTGDQTLEATIIGWSLGGDPDPYQIWHSSQIPDPAKNVTGLRAPHSSNCFVSAMVLTASRWPSVAANVALPPFR